MDEAAYNETLFPEGSEAYRLARRLTEEAWILPPQARRALLLEGEEDAAAGVTLCRLVLDEELPRPEVGSPGTASGDASLLESAKKWAGPPVGMKETAKRLGFGSPRAFKSYLEQVVRNNATDDPLWEFRPGGTARVVSGKFREEIVASFEKVRERVPQAARAIADSAATRAIEVGKSAARTLPLTALKKAFGRRLVE
jgi:hypothetical protein